MKRKLWLDFTTLATLQDNGDICCPTCGSWTTIEDLEADKLGTEVTCPLCSE
jgi:predicted RNA-binding Zn-ribbon protein involved in translation (DUF1610 family)